MPHKFAPKRRHSRSLRFSIDTIRGIVNKFVYNLITKRITIAKWQFNAFGVAIFVIGTTFGGYITLSNSVFKPSKALAESSYSVGQGLNSELTSGTGSNVTVTASSVTLSKDSNWWSLSWNYKRALTIKNFSSSTLSTNTPVQVTINTTGLESVLSSCNDLRIVYQNSTDLPRSYVLSSGAAGCTSSTATQITFPLQADIASGASDTTNYTIYFGNASASAPSYPHEKGLIFDGTNDYFMVSNFGTIATPGSQLSMTMWIKPTSFATDYAYFAYTLSDTPFAFYVGSSTLRENLRFSTSGGFICQDGSGNTEDDIPLNRWNQIGFVYNAGTATLYLNGTSVAQCTGGPATITGSSSNLYFGGSASTRYYTGLMDEVQLWNTSFTQQQIQDRMYRELDSTDSLWSNLKGYWKMNDGSGQSVSDASGNTVNGTLGANSSSATDDPAWITASNSANSLGAKSATLVCPFNETTTCLDGKTASTATGTIRYGGSKGAMRFDSVDDYVAVADSTSFQTLGDASNSLSFELWMKRDAVTGTLQNFIEKNQGGNLSGWAAKITTSGYLQARLGYSGTFTDVLSATNPLTTTNWYHVAFVADRTNNTAKWYVNGVTDTNVVNISSVGSLANTVQLNVGAGAQSFGTTKFGGLIDEVAVYNRALSAAEITAHYNGGNPAPLVADSNTKLLLHLDENGIDPRTSNKAIDASGNGNNGTLVNGPVYIGGVVGIDGDNTQVTGKVPAQSVGEHQGVLSEEATTNYVINPSAETDTSSWSCYDNAANCALTRVTSESKFGGASFRIQTTASGASIRHQGRMSLATYGLTAGGQYCLSAYLKVTAGSAYIDAVFTGTATTDTASSPLAIAAWNRIISCGTVPATATALDIKIATSVAGADFYVDGIQIEPKWAATSYTDGSLGTGYAWTGTAHASTSTRTGTNIMYNAANVLSPTTGAISVWSKINYVVPAGAAANQYLFYHSNAGANRLYLYLNNGGFGLTVGTGVTVTGTAATPGQWYHTVVTWNNGTFNWWINGVAQTPVSSSFSSVNTTFTIGGLSGAQTANGLVSDLRLYDVDLTINDAQRLYNSGLAAHTAGTSSQAKYASSGTWTSAALDLGNVGAWGANPNFLHTETLDGNTISYETRTSTDGSSWNAYQEVQGSNSIQSPNAKYLQIRATLNSTNQTSTPQFSSATVHYVQDSTPPTTNADTITMLKTSGGDPINNNEWTNNVAPYFSWSAGTDNAGGSGMKGYCVYLGSDQTGDPALSKGLLGTSPSSTSPSTCQFVTTATSLDLSSTSLRGSTWLSSSSTPYYLNIKAVDNTGNVYPTSAQFQFRYDSTAANNPSALSAPQGYQRDIASFTVSWPITGSNIANDNNSGIKGYQYRIGSTGTWYGPNHTGAQDCSDVFTSGSYTLDPEFDTLSVGENTFYLRTWDNTCNVSTNYVSVLLKYSSDAPSAPQDVTATPETNSKNLFAFSWTIPSIYNGNQTNLMYCYTINTLPSAESCTWTNGLSLDADAYATQPGKNTFYLVTKDEASNVNYDDHAQVNFYANTSAPGIAQNIDVSDVSVKSIKSWKLALSWETPSDTGASIKNYKVYRSNEDILCTGDFAKFKQIAITSGTSYVDVGLTQQRYSYCVKACDSANNCSAVSNTVNKLPTGKFTHPAEITTAPVTTDISTRKATILWGTDRTSDSKVSYGLKQGEYYKEEPSNSTQTKDHSITLNNLQPGATYFYQAKWTDEDGNTGISEERSFTTSPSPSIPAVNVTNITINSAIVTFTVKNSSKVTLYYGKTTAYGGTESVNTSSVESTYSIQLKGLEDGTSYNYTLKLQDADGYEYDSLENHVFTTIARPRVTNVKVQEVKGSAQPTVLVTWNSNTEISSIVSFTPENARNLSRDEVNVTFTKEHKVYLKGLMAQTNYVMTVKGVDRNGNEAISDSMRFNTATDTRPAKISNLKIEGSPVPAIARAGEAVTAQLVISWDTDEPTTSQVEYGEGSGTTYPNKSQEDTNLTYNHIVVISNLTPSKVYHLRVVTKDKAGNEGNSGDTITITPKATQSALDLVIGNLSDVFKFFSF